MAEVWSDILFMETQELELLENVIIEEPQFK